MKQFDAKDHEIVASRQAGSTISLSGKYTLTNIDGMTMHTLLTALADAEGRYKKARMIGLAENAANVYRVILGSISF